MAPEIAAWITAHRPCFEGSDRLSEHASMAAAWDASTHGPYLFFMLRAEDKVTPEALAVKAKHQQVCVATKKAALKRNPNAERLQIEDPHYADAVIAYAVELKSVVDNPFV